MSYSINGKIFTSHALMDEIVFNTKKIIKGLVLKNQKLADSYETEYTVQQADYYIACLNGTMDLGFFPLSREILIAYGCTALQASEWSADYTKIPEELRDEVLTFCCDYFVNNYEERNDYYRRLNGQPEYNPEHPDDYNITLSRYDYYDDNGELHSRFDDLFSKDTSGTDYNHDLPLHKFSVTDINTLESIGVMQAIRDIEINSKTDNSTTTIVDSDGTVRVIDDTAKHYRYLDYLGSKQISIYTARIASRWEILYIPGVENLVQDRFMELYSINREIYERRTYQLAYSESSDYFEEIMILMIIGQTFADIITDTPEWYIRRDVFDLRTVQYFLNSQGIKFFEDIPMKYQIRIVKGMNKLIKYKSTDKNIMDILELFDIKGINVFRYYIMKHYKRTDVREFVVIGEEDKEWSMEAEYDFGYEDEEDIGSTGDGYGNDVEGAEVFNFIDMDDDEYVDPEADADYYYDFRSEDADYFADNSYFLLPEYDFHDEDSDPDTIHNTSYEGLEDNTVDELFDFGLLAWDVIEDYDERELIYDFNSEDSGYVYDTETTERHLNYQEKVREIKDEFGNVYELEFVKAPVGELYDDYVKNYMYRERYDYVVKDDPYWNGEDVHYLVRNNHLQKDFTIEGTKYLGIEYSVDMKESLYEKAYYLGTLLNSRIDTEDITISIPQLSNKKFTLLNLLIFVYCLNGIYTDNIIPIEDATKFVTKRTKAKPEFDKFEDFDGGFVWTGIPDPTKVEPDPEPFYGYDDYGFEDTDNIDPDKIEIYKDFGYNYYIDWEATEYYENYDYGLITDTSVEDEYSEQPKVPEIEDPEFDYPYDAYVWIDPNRPYYYCNAYYLDQTNGERTLITHEFMDNHPELLNTYITIVYLWTEWTQDQLGYYTLTLDNHGVDDWNDKDQYELSVDGGTVEFSSALSTGAYYDYIRDKYPYIFVDNVGRVLGFNMTNKLTDIANDIGFRHSTFGFERGYTLEECGVADFLTVSKIDSIAEMDKVYQINTECYKTLMKKMKFAQSRDERRVLEYVYTKLFTVPWNTKFYILQNGEIADSYDQILKERDYNLYSYYLELLNEGDSKLRILNTRNCLNNIADTLNYYIHGNNLQYVLSFIGTMSYDALLHYVNEMIDFFKSWKLHFLDPKLSYIISNNSAIEGTYADQIGEIRAKYWTPDNFSTGDAIQIKTLYDPIEKPGDLENLNMKAEVIDVANHYVEFDILIDKDYDGGDIENIYEITYQYMNGGEQVEEGLEVIPQATYTKIDGGLSVEDSIEVDPDNIDDPNFDCNIFGDASGEDPNIEFEDIDGGDFAVKYIANGDYINGGLETLTGLDISPRNTFSMIDGGMETEDSIEVDPNADYLPHVSCNNLFAAYTNEPDLLCQPYYQVDCGEISSRMDLYDLDGGGVLEANEYLTVDGLHIYDPLRFVPSPQGSPMYDLNGDMIPDTEVEIGLSGYDVEGGRPDIRHVVNNGIVVNIDEYNQVSSDIIRCPYVTNGLEIKDDGIYFNYDKYATKEMMSNQIVESSQYMDEVLDALRKVYDVTIVLNPGGLDMVTYNTIRKNLEPYFKFINKFTNSYETDLTDRIVNNGEELKNWFTEINPFNWVAL